MNSKRHEQEYRTPRVSLLADDVFMTQSALAVKVYFALLLMLPTTGIGLVARRILAATASELIESVNDALDELTANGFVRVEANVVWIVNALDEAVGLSTNDPNHRKFVRSKLANAPADSPIVAEFRARYAKWFVDAEAEAPSEPPTGRLEPPYKQGEVEVDRPAHPPALPHARAREAEPEPSLESLRAAHPDLFTAKDRLGINSAERLAKKVIAAEGVNELARMFGVADEWVVTGRCTLTDAAGAISDLADNQERRLTVQKFRRYLEKSKPLGPRPPRTGRRSRSMEARLA